MIINFLVLLPIFSFFLAAAEKVAPTTLIGVIGFGWWRLYISDIFIR